VKAIGFEKFLSRCNRIGVQSERLEEPPRRVAHGNVVVNNRNHGDLWHGGFPRVALMAWHRHNELSQRLTQIPGVGPIGATLLALKTPDPSGFRSARHFAAWIGLTPKDHSTGGKTRLGTITRAGDEGLRSVLVVGATALIRQVRPQPRAALAVAAATAEP